MFDHLHYVPVLKWRQGEYQALLKLAPTIKDWVTPLFEIPTEQWDFENDAPAKSLDEHLGKFGRRLKAKWGSRYCFVDSCYLQPNAQNAAGVHHLAWIFELARQEGAKPIPVTGLGRAAAYTNAVKQIVAIDGSGCCIRLVSEDFDRPQLKNELLALLDFLGVKPTDADIVIDLQDNVGHSASAHARLALTMLQQLPLLARWRTLTIAGGSFPTSLPSATFRPSGTTPRFDWLGYRALVLSMPENIRVPTFADYSVSAQSTELLDPRVVDPLAKIKYTVGDEWFLAVGTQVKRNGRDQYVDLCKTILNATPSVFHGAPYSWGDEYIDGCAKGLESTGGSSTWPSVATNHHVTRVVRDVAKLHAASSAP